MENPIKIDDLGVPLFLETPICIYIYITKTEFLWEVFQGSEALTLCEKRDSFKSFSHIPIIPLHALTNHPRFCYISCSWKFNGICLCSASI